MAQQQKHFGAWLYRTLMDTCEPEPSETLPQAMSRQVGRSWTRLKDYFRMDKPELPPGTLADMAKRLGMSPEDFASKWLRDAAATPYQADPRGRKSAESEARDAFTPDERQRLREMLAWYTAVKPALPPELRIVAVSHQQAPGRESQT